MMSPLRQTPDGRAGARCQVHRVQVTTVGDAAVLDAAECSGLLGGRLETGMRDTSDPMGHVEKGA